MRHLHKMSQQVKRIGPNLIVMFIKFMASIHKFLININPWKCLKYGRIRKFILFFCCYCQSFGFSRLDQKLKKDLITRVTNFQGLTFFFVCFGHSQHL